MEIEKFDRMAAQDQSDYIVVLIEGAQKVLIQSGRKDIADKVHKLFVTILPGDQDPVGAVEFESNLARARLADIRNLEKDPNAARLEVEDAMAVTLKKNGIELLRIPRIPAGDSSRCRSSVPCDAGPGVSRTLILSLSS